MVVGILRLTLYLHGAASLKDKRQALRRINDRLRSRYNVSVAEVGANDAWQRALVGIAAVSNDRAFVNEVLDKCVRDVEATAVAEITNREMEIETYSQMQSDWARMGKPDLDVREPEPEPEHETGSALGEGGWLTEEDLPE